MSQPDWQTVKEYEDITYKKAHGVARIAINRPEVRNAFRPETLFELSDAFGDANEDSSIAPRPTDRSGLRRSSVTPPPAIRVLKSAFNADVDGQAGLQELAGNATLLFYMTEQGQEGRDAYLQKRKPEFRKYPWLSW